MSDIVKFSDADVVIKGRTSNTKKIDFHVRIVDRKDISFVVKGVITGSDISQVLFNRFQNLGATKIKIYRSGDRSDPFLVNIEKICAVLSPTGALIDDSVRTASALLERLSSPYFSNRQVTTSALLVRKSSLAFGNSQVTTSELIDRLSSLPCGSIQVGEGGMSF